MSIPPDPILKVRRFAGGSNAAALEVALEALEGLTDEHVAIVEHARTLARLIDQYPTEVKLHGEYRQVTAKLLEVGKAKEVDAFEKLLKELRGETAPDAPTPEPA